jgi:hypothetical protein
VHDATSLQLNDRNPSDAGSMNEFASSLSALRAAKIAEAELRDASLTVAGLLLSSKLGLSGVTRALRPPQRARRLSSQSVDA